VAWFKRRQVPEAPSSGVSSFHLWWGGLPDGRPVVEVAATLTIVEPPSVDRLYFWALQATFADASRTYGAAHTGLQWNPNFPRARAVNWGGYADPPSSHVFNGSIPALPGSPDDLNTRAYPWEPSRGYRFRIYRSPVGWRSEVTDVASGETTVIRDLYAGGDQLRSPVVWSEVFARCVDPPAAAHWSDLTVTVADGRIARAAFVTTSFPTGGDCPNTDSVADATGIMQRTNTPRTSQPGARIPLPNSRPGG
jgi:hypothetical protein